MQIRNRLSFHFAPAFVVWAVLLSALILLAGCGETPAPEAAVERYTLHGTVVQLNPQNKVATIEHDEIVGWMGAMTMDFPVKDQVEWDKLHVGDRITGAVFVSSDGFHLGEIKTAEPAAEEEKLPESPAP
jgi:Cu/Ag efflux protein CusF